MKLKHSLLIAALLAPLSLAAHASDGSTILGGALGGGAGAAIGNSVGGRDGAIIGGALGGAVGAKIGSDYRERPVVYERAYPVREDDDRDWHDNGKHKGWYKHHRHWD